MQMAVIEAARSLGRICRDAGSTEFGPCEDPIVGLLTEWTHGNRVEEPQRRRATWAAPCA